MIQNMGHAIIGASLILFGLWFGRYAIKNRGERGFTKADTYIFIGRVQGSIGLIFIGIMMLLQKW